MKIVIAGAGDVGFHLAELLAYENQDIVLIDTNLEVLDYAATHLDVLTLHGDVTSIDILEQAQVYDAKMFLAVTTSEKTNLVAAILAKKMGAKQTIARVDNAEYLQDLLGQYANKILLAINGHTHIDDLLRIQGVTYLHLNSASYQWVGGNFKHQSYSEAVHQQHPWISHTCPYRDSLFATLVIDPATQTIRIEGQNSSWVGPSPAALGTNGYPELHVGEEVAPRIRDRQIELVGKE